MGPNVVIPVAIVLGLIPAFIAKHKGDSFFTFWLFGTLLWIVALPYALFVLKDKRRRCDHCAELVRPEARVCPHCQRDLTTAVGFV